MPLQGSRVPSRRVGLSPRSRSATGSDLWPERPSGGGVTLTPHRQIRGGTSAVWSLVLLWLVAQLFDYWDAVKWLAPKVLGFSMSPDRAIFVVLFAVLAFSSLRPRTGAPLSGTQAGVMLAFFTMCMGSWHFANSDAFRNRWLTSIFQLSAFPFCAYLLTRRLPFDLRQVLQLQNLFLAMSVYFAITGIAEHYDLRWLVWPSYIMDPNVGLTPDRARGPLLNAADQGWVLAGGAALACIRIPRSAGVSKMLLVGLLAICVIACYFTYTRGSWLALVTAAVTAAWMKRRAGGLKVVSALTAALLILAIAGFASKFSFYEDTLFSRRQSTVDYRKAAMTVAWEIFVTHPVVGIGYGNFGTNLEQFGRDSRDAHDIPLDDGNHNLFLGLASEMGIVGLLLYVGVFSVVLWPLWSFWKRVSDNDTVLQDLLAHAAAMTLTFFLQSQFGDWRFHQLPHSYLFVILGLAASAAHRDAAPETAGGVLSSAIGHPSLRLGSGRHLGQARASLRGRNQKRRVAAE
jgi:O-antigen ligase